MVFDVAASAGGALTVLNEFYGELVSSQGCPEVYLVHSSGEFAPSSSVRTIKIAWPKKNWLCRLVFDVVCAPILVRRKRAATVVSLQNLMVPFISAEKILLVHTPIPFGEISFELRREPRLWAYRNLIAIGIRKSIHSSDKVIVQTRWMKDAIHQSTGVAQDRVVVIPPRLNTFDWPRFVSTPRSFATFLYPASGISYKNHQVVIDAVSVLRARGLNGIEVVLTLDGDESPRVSRIRSRVQKEGLPIRFAGSMQREEVLRLMERSILLFPSLLETYGLPLAEARAVGSPVLAARRAYALEVLAGYENAHYFDPMSAEDLADQMWAMFVERPYTRRAEREGPSSGGNSR